jgi:O-antigen/teichoic acid export membrane protein
MLQISSVQATYLRAFKQEPFLPLSVMGAVVIGLGTLLLTPSMGAFGAAVSYLMGMTVGLAWGTSIFMRYRKVWTVPA